MRAACQRMFYLSATRGRRSFLTLFEDETCVVRIALASCTPPTGLKMEVVMGPAAWGESEGAEPDSPSSVLETLALHPSGNSKVRRMSKEFERLLQHRACAGEQPQEGQPCCENPVAPPGASALDTPPTSAEAYPVGLEQAGTFVAMLRERRQSLRSLRGALRT